MPSASFLCSRRKHVIVYETPDAYLVACVDHAAPHNRRLLPFVVERQRAQFCAVHALRNVLANASSATCRDAAQAVTVHAFEEERRRLIEDYLRVPMDKYTLDQAVRDIGSKAEGGNYNVQLIIRVAIRSGLTCTYARCRSRTPSSVVGYIVNQGGHYYAVMQTGPNTFWGLDDLRPCSVWRCQSPLKLTHVRAVLELHATD